MNFTIKELNELIYSLGTTAAKGKLCDKELNASLLDKICEELNRKFTNEEADYLTIVEQDEQRYKDSHFVSNEEADEDASLHMLTSFPIVDPFTSEYKPKGVTQAILNFVQLQGDATYTEMQNFYRKEFGSNSFSHILKSLTIPYKNRPTRRYLSKMSNGNYEVRLANPSNWVVVESDFIKWIRGNTK
jgi:hypothetical protein